MTLDAIVKSVKGTLKEEIWSYPGKKGCAMGNGIRAAIGYYGFHAFDSDLLQAVCLTYAVIKGVQFVKDLYRYLW